MSLSRPRVAVLDYGSGNTHSAMKALQAAGADVCLTSSKRELLDAAGLVVPGVGAFAEVMGALAKVGGAAVIDRRLSGDRPVFGICAGLQVFFAEGDEGGSLIPGLGQWPGRVSKLRASLLPHMGWNTVAAAAGSVLFAGVEEERFYFVHSYAVKDWRLGETVGTLAPRVSWAVHGERFVAAVENGPLTATQFHPEKSGVAGVRLLRNWVRTL